MNRPWVPFAFESLNGKLQRIGNYREWREFMASRTLNVLKKLILRGSYMGEPVVIYHPSARDEPTLVGFFRKHTIDFRLPKGLLASGGEEQIDLYYYQLMRAAGRVTFCRTCGHVNKGKEQLCELCGATDQADLENMVKILEHRLIKPPTIKRLPPQGPPWYAPSNSSFASKKYWK